MILKPHKLVTYEFHSENRQGLQHYVECSCGFQSRLGTEQAAKSQFDNHLNYHGHDSYFSNLVTGVAKEESGSDTEVVEAKKEEEQKSSLGKLGQVKQV